MSRRSNLVPKPTARSMAVSVSTYQEGSRGREKKGKSSNKKQTKQATVLQPSVTVYDEPVHCAPEPYAEPDPDPSAPSADHQDWVDEGVEEMHRGDRTKKASTSTHPPLRPNQYLEEWLKGRCDTYLADLFRRDSPPKDTCSFCRKSASEYYRCNTCLAPQSSCKACTLVAHQHSPTHHISKWTGELWAEESLSNLGLILHLGHPGEPAISETCCDKANTIYSLTVGDMHGMSIVRCTFCTHAGSASRASQLIAAGLFPCTDNVPKSAFTLNMLRHLSVFSTTGKCSGYKYWSVIKRLTKTGFPGSVANRYRELLQTLRKYNVLVHRKRSGVAFKPHPIETDPSDQAQMCVACPRLKYNFNPSEIKEDERGFFRFWASLDGNYRSPRKAKKVDGDDVCFTDGDFYFPKWDDYVAYVKLKHGEQPEADKTKPDCDSHKAAKDKFVRYLGVDVSGVGAVTCARHSCFMPRGMVDFFKGERFAYTDYAFASFVKYIIQDGTLDFGLTYDIWCHWHVKWEERMKDFPDQIKLPLDLDLQGGIPKFHLIGHQPSCHDRFNLNYMQHVGRIEGEGCERAWAYLNETGGSTSEMSPGFRRDTINYLLHDWNFSKIIGMHAFLSGKYVEALKAYNVQLNVFNELDSIIPDKTHADWEKLSLEAEKKNGQWTSVFSTPSTKGKLQEVAKGNKTKESIFARVASKKPGATQWIITGIELESNMKKLRDEREKITKASTVGQCDAFDAKRKDLNERIIEYRRSREVHMLGCPEPDHPDVQKEVDADPENAELGLPSAYLPETLRACGLSSFIDLEAELRRAICNDGLENVRELLGAKALTIKFKNQNIRGEKRTTRAEAKLSAHQDRIYKAQWRYNNSRGALLRLGATQEDLRIYRKLEKGDLKYLSDYIAGESSGLGQGHATLPWLWSRRTESFSSEEDWQVQAYKVEWFRSRERFRRWEEELKLLKREMVMTHRSFKTHEAIWAFKALPGNSEGEGMPQYALARSNFFRELAEQLFKTCMKHIKEDTVSLEWCNDWLKREGHVMDNAPSPMDICGDDLGDDI